MHAKLAAGLLAVWTMAGLAGCASDRPHASRELDFGKTYYIDGAGNWGFGITTVGKGLKEAGYLGSVEAYIWTTSFNPAIDQVNRPAAHLRAAVLSDKIRKYLQTYPDNDVNIIALSAGTGVAVWAIEALPAGMRINNLVLLGSSLSSTYNMSKAFQHIKGRVYVYYSPTDPILSGPVRLLGTIDGSYDDSAGLVGLRGVGLAGAAVLRIVNIPWRDEYAEYGWAGGHTDSTSEPFIRQFVAPNLVARRAVAPRPSHVGLPPVSVPMHG